MAGNLDKITKIKNDAINGTAEFKITTEAKDGYVNAIHEFRDVVKAQIDRLNGLQGYGNSGGFASAAQAKQNLIDGCNEFKTYMGHYNEYLDQLAQTVEEAYKKFQAQDHH